MIRIQAILFPFLAFFLPFLLFLKTLSPTFVPIDSAEFALCMNFWGICHPPGFPLFILTGFIFSHLFSLGSLIFKANLLSAIYASLTVFLLYLSLKKLEIKPVYALLIATIFATTSIFWEYSTSADVFTFGSFLLSLMFFLIFSQRIYLSFFVLGLSASHFYLTAILFPIIYWYFWGFKINLKNLIAAGLISGLGLFAQVLMYLRMLQNPDIDWGHVQNFNEFIDFVRRKEFGSFFLISNADLTFSPLNFLKHIWAFLLQFLKNFAILLPILSLFLIFTKKIFKEKNLQFLLLSFFILLIAQLFTLSTIDPTNNVLFQIDKFYILPIFIATLIIGICLNSIPSAYQRLTSVVLSVILLINFLINLPNHDLSDNYFSQQLVVDAFSQLPANSIAIVTKHENYFGALYLQKILHQFNNLTVFYLPNEKNRDSENYHPELLKNQLDGQFSSQVTKYANLNSFSNIIAEVYILQIISKNLDKPIFIAQGVEENAFFNFLRPFLSPYGLWWRISASKNPPEGALFTNFQNYQLDKLTFQQKRDAYIYPISYHTQALEFAKNGQFDLAVEFFKKAQALSPQDTTNIEQEIALINRVKGEEAQVNKMIIDKNEPALTQLYTDLYTIGDYQKALQINLKILEFNPTNAKIYANIGSLYALLGDKENSRVYYQRALSLDPNSEIAKKGLEKLEQ